MQRRTTLAAGGRAWGLLARAFSAAAEPAAALDTGAAAAVSALRQRLATGERGGGGGGGGGGAKDTHAEGVPCSPSCCASAPPPTPAGPDLGDFIKGSDLSGYSVHAPRPKVRRRPTAGRAC